MIKATINTKGVERMLSKLPKQLQRATETAIDMTGRQAKKDLQDEIKKVFHVPVPFSKNSPFYQPTQNHDMKGLIGLKEPARMSRHYLWPQVEGGARKEKGFERALGMGKLLPGKGAKMTGAGNVSPGQIRQMLSVLGKAEMSAGYSANITNRSRKRNKKERDYFILRRAHGKLPPGVYQRYVKKGSRGFGAKTKATMADPSKAWQQGQRRGRFAAVIRARGIKPIFVTGASGVYSPRLDFYGVVERTVKEHMRANFERQLQRFVGKAR